MVSERFASRWDTLAFVACVGLALVARAVPEQAQEAVSSGVRRTVLAPFLLIEEQTSRMRAAYAQAERFLAERDSAALRAMNATALAEENRQLRQLLALTGRLPDGFVAATVLRQATPTRGLTVVLSKGARDGVRLLAPVVTPGGLLGVVRSVDPQTSVAVLWTHPDFRVSAMTPDGGVFGLVQPRGGSPDLMTMLLVGVPYRDTIPPGTPLLTAGFGGVYPRGIPIGTVMGMLDEQVGLARSYVVRAAVHPGSASHVIVLVRRTPDVASAFVRESLP
ncbi:MAG: rod shape-determining protein MreC [Gemmatimonadota bacterium]|nr:rod shape-determining protein MreC [Gemmatimonadota bacterium]MDH5197646.1 rod shape-determining protein MreC [Gemmatimonadota bacterium]